MTPGENVPVLASKLGFALVIASLFQQGALCDQCGFGTRATSKKWRTCKRCGHRMPRPTNPPAPEEPK